MRGPKLKIECINTCHIYLERITPSSPAMLSMSEKGKYQNKPLLHILHSVSVQMAMARLCNRGREDIRKTGPALQHSLCFVTQCLQLN